MFVSVQNHAGNDLRFLSIFFNVFQFSLMEVRIDLSRIPLFLQGTFLVV